MTAKRESNPVWLSIDQKLLVLQIKHCWDSVHTEKQNKQVKQMPRINDLTRNQYIELIEQVKSIVGSKGRKADVIDAIYQLLEDVPGLDDQDKVADTAWKIYRYGEKHLPKEQTKTSKTRTGTKAEIAREIIRSNPDMTRKDIIPLLIEQAGLTKAGANTYLYTIKRELKKEMEAVG